MHAAATRRGPLRAGELAEAVVLADLTLVTAIAGQLLPAPIGTALLVIAVVPMAVLGARNRFRAVLAGTLSAAGVGFLVLGLPVVQTVFACAAIGGVVGFAARRGWGIWRTDRSRGRGAVADRRVARRLLFLWTFSRNRELVLDQIRNSFSGISRLLRNVNLEGASKGLEDAVDVLVRLLVADGPGAAARLHPPRDGVRVPDRGTDAAPSAPRVPDRRPRARPRRTARGERPGTGSRAAAIGRLPLPGSGPRRAARCDRRDRRSGVRRGRRPERIREVDARA